VSDYETQGTFDIDVDDFLSGMAEAQSSAEEFAGSAEETTDAAEGLDVDVDLSDVSDGLEDGDAAAEGATDSLVDVSDAFDDASDSGLAFSDVADSSADSLFELDAAGAAAGGAIAGLGVGAQSTMDRTSDLRETVALTDGTMADANVSTSELARSMSDATFSTDEAVNSLDFLVQAGVRGEDQLRETALAADEIADATGGQADVVASEVTPVLSAYGDDVEDLGELTDEFAFAVRNSELSMSDLTSTLQAGRRAGLDEMVDGTDEAIGVLGAFQDETGLMGRDLRRSFREELREADGDLDTFAENTGISADALAEFEDEIPEGFADDLATEAEETTTLMDDLRVRASDLGLEFGEVLQPVNAAAPALTGVGTAAVGLSAVNTGTLVPSLLSVTAALGPVGLAAAGLVAVGGALAFLFRDDLAEGLGVVSEFLSDRFGPVMDEMRETGEAWMDGLETLGGVINEAFGDELELAGEIAEAVLGTVADIFVWTIDSNISTLKALIALLRGDFSGAFGHIEDVVGDTFGRITGVVSDIPGAFREHGRDAVESYARILVNWTPHGIVWRKRDEILDALPSVSDAWDAATGFVDAFIDGIRDRVPDVGGAVDDLTDEVASWLPGSDAERGALSNLTDRGRAIPETLAEGVRDEGGLLRDAVEDISEDAMRGLTMRDVEQHLEDLDDADPDDLDAETIADVDPELLADVAFERQADALAEEQALAETQEIVDERLAAEFGGDIEDQQADIARPMKNAAIPGLEEAAEETDWSVEQMTVAEADADELIDTSERQLLAGVGDSEAPLPSEGTDATATSPGDGPVVERLERVESVLMDLPGEFASVMDGLILVLSGSMDLEGDVVSPDELRGELKRVARQVDDNR